MNILKLSKEEFLKIAICVLLLIFFLVSPIEAIELDLTAAQNAVGNRFASKFCEAKKKGFSSETSSEFALNNTYLKFVAFPEDDMFVEDLWEFTIKRIRKDCGNYLTEDEEIDLRDFFQEEGEIASSRDFYLPQ
tara:strand:- start:68 stop:469 length:402 start_codon:yes stop_codon:yes gene_type:complete